MNGLPCCRELARLVATDEIANAPWSKRLVARVHLFVCRPCRAYCEQLRAIGSTVRDLHTPSEVSAHAEKLIELLKRR